MNNMYHGSPVQNLLFLKPFCKTDNTIKKSLVYLTPNPYLALFYIWTRTYKFVTFEEDESGKVIYTEWFENQLYDFYNHVSGSIYICNAETPSIRLSHIKGVYTSDSEVKVEKELPINNVYTHILNQAEHGNIIINHYQQLSDDEKKEISEKVIRAIHMQHLLLPESNHSQNADFIREHFPHEWEEASQMDDAHVKTMIDQWRNSLK